MVDIILSLSILLFSVIIHEVAHGAVAYSLGDSTANDEGRLSLNPLVHIDPMGSIIVPAMLAISNSSVIFGWAKPVPVDFFNLNDKWGELKVALAGPAINFLLALIFVAFIHFGLFANLNDVFVQIIILNVGLAVFNLIPVFPLDGSHILFNLLPDSFVEFKKFMVNVGYFALLIFLFLFNGAEIIGSFVINIVNFLI